MVSRGETIRERRKVLALPFCKNIKKPIIEEGGARNNAIVLWDGNHPNYHFPMSCGTKVDEWGQTHFFPGVNGYYFPGHFLQTIKN